MYATLPVSACPDNLRRGHTNCGLCDAYAVMRKAIFVYNHEVALRKARESVPTS